MSRILVVGEDALCCAMGERLVAAALPGWSLANTSIDTRGITKLLKDIPRYVRYAKHVQPVLCVADTDGRCPVDLVSQSLPADVGDKFLLRFAVSEAECWLLSDRKGASEFFSVSIANIPRDPGSLPDAKTEVLRLARRSRMRTIREEVVSSSDINKRGTGYNLHLIRFARESWEVQRAVAHSASLAKALQRLRELG